MTSELTPTTTARRSSSAPRSLPRGRHQLSREDVEQSQRERILLAATEVMAEQGFVATTVADIVARAGVSRKTFYELFDDRLDCFLAATSVAQGVLMLGMREQVKELETGRELGPLGRIDALLAAYLATLAQNPGFARVFLVEVYAAGPEAIAQRRAGFESFIDLFLSVAGPQPPADDRATAEVFVAAVSSLVTHAVGVGDIEAIESVHEPIMSVIERLYSTAG